MSVDYYAYAVVGVHIPEIPRAMKKVRKQAFNHGFVDDGEIEFHPKTGMKLWLDETIEVSAEYPAFMFVLTILDREGNEREDFHPPLIKGQTLIRIPKHLGIIRDTQRDTFYVGYMAKSNTYSDDKSTKVNVPYDLNLLKEELKKLLDPHGLWREELFGLYSILICSY